MRLNACFTAALSFVFSVICAAAYAEGNFDGTWDATVSCADTQGAGGYAFAVPSMVKDNIFHGEKGTQGQPGWLTIDGKIKEDGSAMLYADGLVGASQVAVGHLPPGSKYGYHIKADFSGSEGNGKRVEGRSCDVSFRKKQ